MEIITKMNWCEKKKIEMFDMENWKFFIWIIVKSDWYSVKSKNVEG